MSAATASIGLCVPSNIQAVLHCRSRKTCTASILGRNDVAAAAACKIAA